MAKETQNMVKKILALKNEDEHVDKIVHADDVKAIKKKRKQNIELFSWYHVSILLIIILFVFDGFLINIHLCYRM